MSWTIAESKGKTEKPPVGNHLAILVGIFDMGKQLDDFDPAKPWWQWRAYFVWELAGEQIAGTSKNHVIAIDLSMSTGKKSKLRQFVEARTGKALVAGDFDPLSELGQACFLNVVANGDYTKVGTVAAVPKGVPIPKPTYTPVALTLDEFKAGKPLPEWVPWLYGNPLEDHIRASQEMGGAKPKPRKKADAPAGQFAGLPVSDDGPIPF